MNPLVTVNASLPVDASSRLNAWAIEAKEALSANTLRAYRIDSATFADWCQLNGFTSLPAEPQVVAAFLRHDPSKSVSTIRRRLATISRMHKAAGLPSPGDHDLVRMAMRGLAKTKGTDQRQASPVNQRDADTIKARLGDSLKDARDLALMLVGRDLLARSSELVALELSAIELAEDGALIALRRHKTSTETVTYYIGRDAAQALTAWLQRAGIDQGVVFQSLTKNNKPTGRALDTRDVRRILKGLAYRGGLSHAMDVSGHSLRVGMAQDLVAHDMDLASVMQAGGWTTPRMVARYSEKLSARRGAVARFYGK